MFSREIASAFWKVSSVQEFSRTIFSCALLTVLQRVRTSHAVEGGSTNRCRRYQVVCEIFKSSGGLRTRSTITSGKLPSRNSRSAALIVLRAVVQRTQKRLRKSVLPSG